MATDNVYLSDTCINKKFTDYSSSTFIIVYLTTVDIIPYDKYTYHIYTVKFSIVCQ